jgi:hypothetical protein
MLPFSVALPWKCNTWIVARVVETFVFIVAIITVTLPWKRPKLTVMQQALSRYYGNAIWCIDRYQGKPNMSQYIILRELVMDGDNSLSLTSLSLHYRFANVLHFWTLILLLNTLWRECSGLLTLCSELLYITSLDLYTVSMSSFRCNLTQYQSFSRSLHPD